MPVTGGEGEDLRKNFCAKSCCQLAEPRLVG
jgi:hypothetical protein